MSVQCILEVLEVLGTGNNWEIKYGKLFIVCCYALGCSLFLQWFGTGWWCF